MIFISVPHFTHAKVRKKSVDTKIYPRYFIRIFALPLSRSLAMLFSRI